MALQPALFSTFPSSRVTSILDEVSRFQADACLTSGIRLLIVVARDGQKWEDTIYFHLVSFTYLPEQMSGTGVSWGERRTFHGFSVHGQPPNTNWDRSERIQAAELCVTPHGEAQTAPQHLGTGLNMRWQSEKNELLAR